jgi:PilZ domain
VNELGETREKRRHQRIEMEVEVVVRTDNELLPGRTHDISESGMSAILPVELREGQEVELQIRLPSGTQTARALVRHRNVFRHGFEFVQPLQGIFEALTGEA